MNDDSSALAKRIARFVADRTEAIIARFLPELTIPGFFCGYRRSGFQEGPDLAFTLAHLHALGVDRIAGFTIEEAIARVLRRVDGETTDTFYSYFVAETLLEFGVFEGNPVLAGFNDAERENLRRATDTTSIFDRNTNTLPRYAKNYWIVLARCEWARHRLGSIDDRSLLDSSIGTYPRRGSSIGKIQSRTLKRTRKISFCFFCAPFAPVPLA